MAFSPRAARAAAERDAPSGEVPDRLPGDDRTLAGARARDVERRERCVAAARDLASDTASAAFTVAQVAARAGLSLKAFYRCFPGKDELLLALLEDDSQLGARVLAELIGERADAQASLHAYVTELFALLSVPGAVGYAGVLVREHRRLSEHYPDELRVALAPIVGLLASHIEAATATDDAARDAETMFRVMLQGIDDVVVGRVDDPLELAEYLWTFCWRGLAGADPRGGS